MERQAEHNKSFKLVDFTNKVLTNPADLKKKQTQKMRSFVTSLASKQSSCLPVSDENLNSNLTHKTSNEDIHLVKQQVSTFSFDESKAQFTNPPRCSRTLRKVNMEYFRGKKVVFKQSNVRISFEIVENIFD